MDESNPLHEASGNESAGPSNREPKSASLSKEGVRVAKKEVTTARSEGRILKSSTMSLDRSVIMLSSCAESISPRGKALRQTTARNTHAERPGGPGDFFSIAAILVASSKRGDVQQKPPFWGSISGFAVEPSVLVELLGRARNLFSDDLDDVVE